MIWTAGMITPRASTTTLHGRRRLRTNKKRRSREDNPGKRQGGSLEAGLQAYHDRYDTGARWYAKAVLAAAEKWS